jgi:hypothetical protein
VIRVIGGVIFEEGEGDFEEFVEDGALAASEPKHWLSIGATQTAVKSKKGVPELRDAPAPKLCEPPAPGLRLAKGYPLPIVDHHRERDAPLKMFRR